MVISMRISSFFLLVSGLLMNQAMAASAVCHPFVKANLDKSGAYLTDPQGSSVLIDPQFNDPSPKYVTAGLTVVPTAEAADDALAALPAKGQICVKGAQLSSDTFLAYSIVFQK